MKMYAGMLACAIVLVLGNAVAALAGTTSLAVSAVQGAVWLDLIAGVLALLAGLGLWSSISAREQLEDGHGDGKSHAGDPDAIGCLVEEIGALAEGDLTIHAENNKDLTGEVADAINDMVGTWRARIQTLKAALTQMTPHLEQGVAVATRLMEAKRQGVQELATIAPRFGQIQSKADAALAAQVQIEDIGQHATVLALNAEIGGSLAGDNPEQLLETFAADVQRMGKNICTTSKRIVALQQQLNAEIMDVKNTLDSQHRVAVQASDDAQQTLKSLAELMQAADQLRQSLAGFKMPEALMLRRSNQSHTIEAHS